jgi:glucose/mannose-6-phosphate isomerase
MSDMKTLVDQFPAQLKEAVEIGKKFTYNKPSKEIKNILITGLGGSGIGGTIVSEIVFNECKVPITVNKDYFIPAFIGEDSLVIVCSYSGNTEETLQAMEAAMARKAKIVCITSGGKIGELAKSNNFDHIMIPGGLPPRACLGYSLTQLFYVLVAAGFAGQHIIDELKTAIELIEKEKSNILAEAKVLTDFFLNKLPVIYAVDGYNGVATRFRQQINENSKMLCWHHILPEMNHNELVGWTENHDELAVIILRSDNDYVRTQSRIEISKGVFSKYANVKECYSKGKSQVERSIYLIHLTDWVSVLLAEKKQIDATEVNIINHLKGELSKI